MRRPNPILLLAILLLSAAPALAQGGASRAQVAEGDSAEGNQTGTFARARDNIRQFCAADQACYDAQLQQLVHFTRMMALFNDPGGRTGERCMRAGVVERNGHRLVNWQTASDCMRAAVAGLRMGDTIPAPPN